MQKRKIKLKNQYTKLNSSNFHEKIRQIFIKDTFFQNLSCYQEVPVSYLVPTYKNNSHHIDWYIKELRMVIELHGKQHYKKTNFGNTPYLNSVIDFNNIRYRDNIKKTTLQNENYEYIEISYKLYNKMTADLLKNIILKSE